MTTWTEASSEVIAIANELIEQYHPWLKEARVGFVFRDEPQKSGNKLVIGKVSKVCEQFKPHMDLDFLIWIAESFYVNMDDDRRKALIDHELCHCGFIDGTARMCSHDIEEFTVVVQRWGLWRPDLITFGHAVEAAQVTRAYQMALELEDELKQGGAIAVDPKAMKTGDLLEMMRT